MKLLTLTSLLLWPLVFHAQAQATSELDPGAPANAPTGLVVKISQDGKREVYKANLGGVIDNEQAADQALRGSVKEENKVQSVDPLSELDQTTSDESWHWSWGGSAGYSYNYHCGRGNYVYYPTYSYYYGGYQYNYYSPGYHNGYRYADPYGYHHGRGRR